MLFHEKFDYLLSASGLSNIKLAKMMNVDASLISKWRHGVKNPNKKVYVVQFCEAVIPSFRSDYLREDLARTSGIPLESLGTHQDAKAAVVDWLCEDDVIMFQTVPASGGRVGEPVHDRLAAANMKRRGLALQGVAALMREPERISCLRIFTDEPYGWMRVAVENLDAIAEAYPGLFSKIERVILLISGADKGEKELRCCWEIAEHFTGHCEVSVAMTDERYSGAFQHAISIAGESSALTSFGLNGGAGVFSFLHSDTNIIRELIDAFDTLLGRSQIVLKEYLHYTSWEEADSFKAMLERNNDIYYRSYDIPPALIPLPVINRTICRSGGGSVFDQRQDAFQCDVQSFLLHNRLYTTFPLLRPNEVADGAATFPHSEALNGNTSPCVISAEDYLEILKYALLLYEKNSNLVLKTVAPGEVEYDFLGQETNRYSVSRLKPRRYTHITTQQTLVASATRQLERYFADAPVMPPERRQCIESLRTAVGDFEKYLNR